MDLRATRADINVSQFKKNLQVFRDIIGKEKILCMVVKANAYGHGLVPMSYHAQDIANVLAVATVNEGVQIREAGISLPIFIMSAHLEVEIPILCQYNLTPFISHDKFLDKYQEWAEYYKMILGIHIKIDTGMGRAGVMPNEFLATAQQIQKYPNLFLEGVCTHFASADSDDRFTKDQILLFDTLIADLSFHNINPPLIHSSNTEGTLRYFSNHSLVRVGIGAYGYTDHPDIRPILSLKSKITIVKVIPKGYHVSYGGTWTAKEETRIGVIPVGYADGYMRCLSNKAKVLIDEQLYPILGRVCMDQIIVALPHEGEFLEKDVILYGDSTVLNADTLAQWANTIPYEILTSISNRVPRIYT